MNNILQAWTASFVRRWHTQPQLCDTVDYISGHQMRATALLLLFWPHTSRNAIIDCLFHDQGESASGDMARPAKQMYPALRETLSIIEKDEIQKQGFVIYEMNDEEKLRRKFVDLLDSYLWMLRHKPHMRHRTEWKDQLILLVDWSNKLDVLEKTNDLLTSSERFFT